MVDWINFLFQTAVLVSGLASLLVIRVLGTQKEGLRSIQAIASETAPPGKAARSSHFTLDSQRSIDRSL